MKIGIASDHSGRALKQQVIAALDGVPRDYGVHDQQPVDYPDYATALAAAVDCGELDRGIAICGTGIGMAIVANRFRNVRAALVWDEQSCQLSRTHNDANILCLGARVLDLPQALSLTKLWLKTAASDAERHRRRVAKTAHYVHKPWSPLRAPDDDLYQLCERELTRQREGLELIASENFVSPPLLLAVANPFTNKYAEGLPGRRYYGGCAVTDELERLAIARAKKLFKAEFANVQPHSGAQANSAALMALAAPGDTILGLDLAQGGHLTHGSPVNFSGKLYRAHFYGVHEQTGRIDYDLVAAQAHRLKPKVIIAGASSYPRHIDFAAFHRISREVNARLLVDMAHIAGLVAADLHANPLPWADVVTTTTHKTLRGPRGGLILWNDTELTAAINRAVFPGTQGGPLQHVIAAKALCFKEASSEAFYAYQQQVVANCRTLAAALTAQGMRLVTGGSDNHLLLIDLRDGELSGKDFEQALEKVAITTNKNMIPGDQRSPFVTSGLRLGTPAVTSRGMRGAEMESIAVFLRRVQQHHTDHQHLSALRQEVLNLARGFPLYPHW